MCLNNLLCSLLHRDSWAYFESIFTLSPLKKKNTQTKHTLEYAPKQMTWKWLLRSAGVVCRHMSSDSVDVKASKHSDCVSRSCFLLNRNKSKEQVGFLWGREL